MTAGQMRADLDALAPDAPAGDLYAERIARGAATIDTIRLESGPRGALMNEGSG